MKKSISFCIVDEFKKNYLIGANNYLKKGVKGAINAKKYAVIGASYDIISMC